MNNPFNITKAVDYTDEQLDDFWVDFPSDMGFNGIIKPTSDMPMMILGSKGSGKTHIMKHFSFTMQNIRWKDQIISGISHDGYLGVYLRCSGLNGFKFSGKGETEESWQTIFSYYLELWLSQLLLNNIIRFIESANLKINEHTSCLQILDLLDTGSGPTNIKSFSHIVKYFNELQKEIDYAINNRAFNNTSISESIEVLASAGNLIFGIPEILSQNIKQLGGVKFLYLLDEYENFTLAQQKYFNTLIRERRNPTCFKIGARKYGIRTFETLSANEEIKSGSEFEEFDIDDIFRKNSKDYIEFIKNICVKRLKHSGVDIELSNISDYFEKANRQIFVTSLANKPRKHLIDLSVKLEKVLNPDDIEEIIKNLTNEQNIFLERTNVLMFYREWKRSNNLLIASQEIKTSCESFSSNNLSGRHAQVLDKHTSDIYDALYRENRVKIETYCGFQNLVKISNGIPRHFLIIMKHIYRWNDFFGDKPFSSISNKISIESQLNALSDTTSWFIEDSRYPGKDGNKIKECITRLCDYLRELRFSDAPPECSISTFSIQSKVLPREISEIIEFLEQYSYIIKLNTGRRDKNLNARNISYQINGLLASEFELSISRRCIVDFDFSTIKSIFYPDKEEDYKKMLTSAVIKYNAPFSPKKITPTLFD